jgi:hypothetical protein
MTYDIFRRMCLLTGIPFSVTDPDVNGVLPVNVFSSVDLPAPVQCTNSKQIDTKITTLEILSAVELIKAERSCFLFLAFESQ